MQLKMNNYIIYSKINLIFSKFMHKTFDKVKI